MCECYIGFSGTGPTPPGGQIIQISGTTTSAAAVELLRTDTLAPLVPPLGKTWKVKIELASRRTVGATVGDSTGWEFSFTFKNVGGVISMVGTSTMLYSQQDASTAGIAFDQATLDATAALTVTGQAARTDNWLGNVYVTEI